MLCASVSTKQTAMVMSRMYHRPDTASNAADRAAVDRRLVRVLAS